MDDDAMTHKCPFCENRYDTIKGILHHCTNMHGLGELIRNTPVDRWENSNKPRSCCVGDCPVCGLHITEFRKHNSWGYLFVRHCMQNDPVGHHLALVLMGMVK